MDRNERLERLAVLTAMGKAINAELEDLKFFAKEELLELEDAYGVDRMALKLGGEKVGEVSIVRAKPQVAINPDSYQEAMDALELKGLITITPSKGWQNSYGILPSGDVIDKDSGELVPWAYATEPFVKGTMVKVKQEEGAKKLATMQPITVAGLLGGADE